MQIRSQRPAIEVTEAAEIAERLYGLTGQVTELESERDRNFLIHVDYGRDCILKIANINEDRIQLEFLNGMMYHLAAGAGTVNFPTPILSLDANMIEKAILSDGKEHLIRMVSYLKGYTLSTVKKRPPALLQSFGSLLGRMSKALENYEHQAAKRDFYWDLAAAPRTIKLLRSNISDTERLKLIDFFLNQYGSIVSPVLGQLRRSIIHNDANDNNVITSLVSVPEAGINLRLVTGLVDFGDAVESHTINELAVALAYLMLDAVDPIAEAAELVAAYHREYPIEDVELTVLFTLACMRLCLSVSICAYQQMLEPGNDYLRISEQPAWNILDKLRLINPLEAARRFKASCEDHTEQSPKKKTATGKPKAEILEERKLVIGPSLSIAYKQPLKIVRGHMQYLYDENGRAYLDAVNNVPHVGHCHPRVVQAGQRQMALLNTNTRYLHDNLTEYALRLTAKMPEPLSVCYFVCSGTEANELAIRLARTHTGGKDFIVIDGAYHGNSSGVVDLSPYKFNGPGGAGRADHIRIVPTPDGYRGRYRHPESDLGARYAQHVAEAANAILSDNRRLAGFLAEPILGSAGQIVLPPDYLKKSFDYVRAAGGVCIADEVQIGFGRVGTHFWAFETQGVVPDIVTLGKPIGNGHPLAAVVTTPEIATSFANGMEYFNTFGGNPVSCAIGMAVLDVIENENLQQNALQVGNYLKDELQVLAERHEPIGEVRGLGLFIGVELVKSRDRREPASTMAGRVVESMKEAGVLVSTDGPDENVIKIKPPICFNKHNADQLVEAMDRALAAATE